MYTTKITVIVETNTYEESQVFGIRTDQKLNREDVIYIFSEFVQTINKIENSI